MSDEYTYQDKPIDEFYFKIQRLGMQPSKDASGDKPLVVDDIVNLHLEGRVKAVEYDTDKDGRLIAIAKIIPIDHMEFQPWNPSDPHDDGVSRGSRVIKP